MKPLAQTIFILLLLLYSCSSSSPNDNSDKDDSEEVKDTKPIAVVENAFAFPGAEGFGKNSTGGRGGKVI
ncbi:MAG: pectate lyase, partial [Confluentibacter sp.]|nr:pectate lyase [Confluentibacter sp.]